MYFEQYRLAFEHVFKTCSMFLKPALEHVSEPALHYGDYNTLIYMNWEKPKLLETSKLSKSGLFEYKI